MCDENVLSACDKDFLSEKISQIAYQTGKLNPDNPAPIMSLLIQICDECGIERKVANRALAEAMFSKEKLA